MKMIKQPTIPPMPKRPTFDARDTQYNLPIGTDLISRAQAIDIERNATVDTNPSHFEAHQKFTQFMDDAEISSFGRWQWSNGFNTALTAVGIDLKKLPPAEPKTGKWILDRSGAFCCSNCMEPCAGYVMMKPRDKFCKMCGAKMEVTT